MLDGRVGRLRDLARRLLARDLDRDAPATIAEIGRGEVRLPGIQVHHLPPEERVEESHHQEFQRVVGVGEAGPRSRLQLRCDDVQSIGDPRGEVLALEGHGAPGVGRGPRVWRRMSAMAPGTERSQRGARWPSPRIGRGGKSSRAHQRAAPRRWSRLIWAGRRSACGGSVFRRIGTHAPQGGQATQGASPMRDSREYAAKTGSPFTAGAAWNGPADVHGRRGVRLEVLCSGSMPESAVSRDDL